MRPKPVVLIIRDGWGIRKEKKGNAIALGKTPNADKYVKKYPTSVLKCTGEHVGLPKGYQGSSEVGHINIGAGRVVNQMATKINHTIKDGRFFRNKALVAAMTNCKRKNSTLHIMGLISDEGVHALQQHCIALLKLAKLHKIKKIFVHPFTDGRDTPPKSAMKYISAVEKEMKKLGVGKFGVLVGRYYAMDRNAGWKRTKLAYDALVEAKGERVKSVKEGIELAYAHGEEDEFIKPKIIEDFMGIKNNDSVIFFNYRLDRARQLTHAFTDKTFRFFVRKQVNSFYVCFTPYYEPLNAIVAFQEEKLKNILGEVISRNKLTQLRTAETEKYAHVTFFFNAESEIPFPGEDRIIVPSPKVATYDQKPDMSAFQVTRNVIKSIKEKKHDVIIINYANGDMVGHTGNIKAGIEAVEAVDECVGLVVDETVREGGVALITADHGNCEEMSGNHLTSHTLNDVYFHIAGLDCRIRSKGKLADIAPTMLDILEIPHPVEMTGESLIVK